MATVEDKIQRIIKTLESNTSLKNLVPGTTMHSLVEASAFENMKVETAKELMEVRQSIVLAGGSDLDHIGEKIFGIQRRESISPVISKDMKLLKFYVSSGTFGSINNGEDILVKTGTVIEGAIPDGYLKFATRADTILPRGASEQFISAELIAGPYEVIPANSLVAHSVRNYAGIANNSLKVTNVETVATGMPPEGDDNYRYRISTALKNFVKTNYFGIHEAVTALPGISDVAIYPADNGGGTFTVYVKSINPSASAKLLDDVKKVIYQNVPPWVNFSIIGPSYVGVKLAITATVKNLDSIPNQDNIRQQIVNEVSSYINNIKYASYDIKAVENIVIGSNPSIYSATLTSATIYRGETFRAAKAIDLEDSASRLISLGGNEELIIEPIRNAVLVSLQ